MIEPLSESLRQRIIAMGSGFWDGPFFRDGRICIHPRAAIPTQEGLRQFTSLKDLENWVTNREKVIAEERAEEAVGMQELDRLYQMGEERDKNRDATR